MDCSAYEWATNEEFYGPLGLDYAYLYYCSFQGEHVLVLLAILLWVMFLMNLLADTATNYFSPTLGFICDKLNLSYDLAGVSFLAFGNGAPDFFALLASFSADIDILVSVGALLGGSVFICTVVAGCIAFLCPCEVSGRSFVRDVVFLLLAVGFVALAALIQEINLGFAFSFIIAYILYAVIVITTPKCFPPPPSENSPNLGNFAMTDFSGEDIQTAFWHRNVAGKSIERKRGSRIIQPTAKLSSSSPSSISSLSTSTWGSGTMKSFSSLAAASASGGTSGYKFLLLDDDVDEEINVDKDEEKANFNSSANGIVGGCSSGGGVGVMEKQTINLSGGFIPEFDDILNEDFYSKDKGIDVVGDVDSMELGYKAFDGGSRIYTGTTSENSNNNNNNNNKDDYRGARSRNNRQNPDDIGHRKQAFVNRVAGVDDCEVDATENRGTAGVLNAPNGVIGKSSSVSCQSHPDPSASSTGKGAESAHNGAGSGDHGYSYSDTNCNGNTGNGKHSSGGIDPLSESLLPSGGEEEYDEGDERMGSNTSSSTSTSTSTSTSFAGFFNIRRIKKRHAHQYRRLAASLYWQQWAMQRRLRRSVISTEWWALPTYQKLISVVFMPTAFLRDITIPTLDNENWSKPYALMHPFAMSIMIAYLFGYIDKFVGPFPVSLICVLASVGPAVAVFALTHQYKAPSGQAFTITWCLLAFGMCIIWTYVVAGELVTCLSVVGLILQLPPSFLGLTVLAWGNSLGDFFTNTAVARQGLGEMAIAGCFGGPVFNILMGLGLSLAYACLEAYPKSFSLQLDWSSMVSLIFLAIALTSSLVFAIMRNFQIDRSLGIYLLTLYVVYTVFQALLLVI